jgi:adenylosuccinate synthase
VNNVDILLGLQWGDEGKGKIVDVLTRQYDLIARFQGGPNAGHTLEFEGHKHVLHTIPSGIFHAEAMNVVGNGVVIDPVIFCREIEELKKIEPACVDRLVISRKAHLILPTHRLLDAASEQAKGKNKIGSTLKGIGPTYMDKTGRNGLRVGDIEMDDFIVRYKQLKEKHQRLLASFGTNEVSVEMESEWMKAIDQMGRMQLVDSEDFVHSALEKEQKILAEGAQGALLDIDFGTYPFVTSSTTTAAGACMGLGIAPNRIGKVFGIFKAYCTRVGSGPFPSELLDETGEMLRDSGKEFGSTTGRPRRCGWLDLPALRYAIKINGVTELIMMKADVLDALDQIGLCTAYIYKGKKVSHLPYRVEEDWVQPIYEMLPGWKTELTGMTEKETLPAALTNYIRFIEEYVGIPVSMVSVGPDRAQTILL